MKLGIDFGTCFSFPAAVRGKGPESLLPNELQYHSGIPSVFYYHKNDGELLGVQAEGQRLMRPGCGVKYIKKDMRSEKSIAEISHTLNNRTFAAREIIEKIIKHIIDLAKQTAPNIPISTELENLVIGVPAMAKSEAYRQVLLEAAMSASNLPRDKVKIIDEPVAAALSYFSTHEDIKNGTVLTYDLGGGTFDTAIVQYDDSERQKFTTIVQSGDTSVGGTNWDKVLRDYFIQEQEINLQKNSADEARFEECIIHLKHELSTKEQAKVVFYTDDENTYILKLSRQQFEQMTRYLLDMTITVVKDIIESYKKKTGQAESSINTIVLVGGASQMPQVNRRLQEEFPGMRILLDKPERAIAFGAAIYASFDTLVSVAPHTYGVDCINGATNKSMISNILFRDSQMEVKDAGKYISARNSYVPHHENQKAIDFEVYETDEPAGTDWTPFDGRKPMFKITVPIKPVNNIETRKRAFDAEIRLLQDGILEIHVYDKDQNDKEVGFGKGSIF